LLTVQTNPALKPEVERRRTFAIISHPDAGKTTLTEKLLLYAGAIELAGAVRGRKTDRHVVSDWMDIERERGISVTSAAVEFDLGQHHLTLLDTPGHKDFSEDTYRTLFAVDGVVMVIDAAKGIESQTRKLFEVCKLRRLPVLTFINKLDLPSRDPFDLLDEIERVLGIHAVPMNWPIGSGDRFRGVYDIQQGIVHLYDRKERAHPAPVNVGAVDDPKLKELIGDEPWQTLVDETSLVVGAGTTFDHQAYLDFRHTPVFFGSALSNFGLEPFLYALTELAPPPKGRESDRGVIPPDAPNFSGFVFKIQANMNKRHRDRVAFLRVCSGVFEKDMVITNAREGNEIRAARPYRFFGGKRETIDKAFAGDVVGLVNPGQFGIGDTLYSGMPLHYPPIARRPLQAVRRGDSSARRRRLDAGAVPDHRTTGADSRHGRTAAARSAGGAPEGRIQRRRRRREPAVHRGQMGGRSGRQGLIDFRIDVGHSQRHRSAGAAGDAVRVGMGARLRQASVSRRPVHGGDAVAPLAVTPARASGMVR
jgi:peptide chain release factor 3